MEKRNVVRGTDDIRINTGDVTELKYWSSKFRVERCDIVTAVGKMGDSLTAVTRYFHARR